MTDLPCRALKVSATWPMITTVSDQILECRLCGDSFVFSAGEQELQHVRGFDRAPTRCSLCKSRPATMPLLPKLARPTL